MSAIVSATATADLERRLSVLEAQVGIAHRSASKNTSNTAAAAAAANNNNAAQDANNNVVDRLAKLRVDFERKVASASSSTTSSAGPNNTINNNNTANNNNNHNYSRESWKECQKLLNELDPGIALTHQQQPLLYKRQQVLASSDELTKDFSELDIILKLLLSGTKVTADSTSLGSSVSASDHNNNNNNASSKTATTGMGASSKTSTTKAGQSSSSEQQKKKQQQLADNNKSKKEQELQRRSGGQYQQQEQQLRLDQVTQAPILTQHMATTAINPIDQKRMELLRQKLLNLNDRTTNLTQTLRHYLECYHTAMTAVSEKIVLADERIIVTTLAAAATGSNSNE